jgi:hypothetical protein
LAQGRGGTVWILGFQVVTRLSLKNQHSRPLSEPASGWVAI